MQQEEDTHKLTDPQYSISFSKRELVSNNISNNQEWPVNGRNSKRIDLPKTIALPVPDDYVNGKKLTNNNVDLDGELREVSHHRQYNEQHVYQECKSLQNYNKREQWLPLKQRSLPNFSSQPFLTNDYQPQMFMHHHYREKYFTQRHRSLSSLPLESNSLGVNYEYPSTDSIVSMSYSRCAHDPTPTLTNFTQDLDAEWDPISLDSIDNVDEQLNLMKIPSLFNEKHRTTRIASSSLPLDSSITENSELKHERLVNNLISSMLKSDQTREQVLLIKKSLNSGSLRTMQFEK